MHDLIDPTIYAEAVDLIADHHSAGRDVVIVSSSGTEVVEPIGEILGADHVIATRMVVEDGRYTGEIAFYAYGPNKADAIRELAAERGYDLAGCFAYSRLLHRPAHARGGRATRTPSTRTSRCAPRPCAATGPCSTSRLRSGLRRRTPEIPPRRVALATVGAAAAAGVVWYAGRRMGRGISGS